MDNSYIYSVICVVIAIMIGYGLLRRHKANGASINSRGYQFSVGSHFKMTVKHMRASPNQSVSIGPYGEIIITDGVRRAEFSYHIDDLRGFFMTEMSPVGNTGYIIPQHVENVDTENGYHLDGDNNRWMTITSSADKKTLNIETGYNTLVDRLPSSWLSINTSSRGPSRVVSITIA